MLARLLQPEFEELIAKKDWSGLKDALSDVPAADIADLLLEIDAEVAIVVFRLLKKKTAAEVFSFFPTGKGIELLELFTKQQLSDVMSNLEPDEQVALLEELPGRLTQTILNTLRPDDLKEVKRLLGYPEESVGRIMTPRYVRVKSDWSVDRSMNHIRKYGEKAETLNVIYVVDDDEKLIDDLRLTQLILAQPDAAISSIMDYSFEALSAFNDQEEAVKMLSKYDRVALPVVDSDGILVGIVTVDDVIDVAEEETTEDMQLMAGMGALDNDYSQTSLFEMIKKRIGWLVVLFIGQMFTVTAMSGYQSIIAGAAILSLFIPMIISSGGNSGSQAATLIIRALSTDDIKQADWRRIFNRELLSGIILGSIVGTFGVIVIFFWGALNGDIVGMQLLLTAIVIGLSLLGVIVFGNLTGAMLPFLLSKLGLDPAVTSAPFVATLVDVTGIIIYFSIAVGLLKGILI